MSFYSEEDFLSFLDKFFPKSHSFVELSRGDDCAVIKCSKKICVSSDLFLESVHFKLDYFSPEDIGYKALAVNISDISAMGAVPKGFFLNLIIPKGLSRRFWERLLASMADLANSLELSLAGGDISKGPSLGFGITIWGEGDRFLKRTPEVGDLIFVIGELGLARVGLNVLEKFSSFKDKFPNSVQNFLRPSVHVNEGILISKCRSVNSLMDVSDGLIKDLERLTALGFGARLFSQALDPHEEIKRFCSLTNEDPIKYLLLGGEDYALLGSVKSEGVKELIKMVPAKIIGEIVDEKGLWLDNKFITFSGFDHFKEL